MCQRTRASSILTLLTERVQDSYTFHSSLRTPHREPVRRRIVAPPETSVESACRPRHIIPAGGQGFVRHVRCSPPRTFANERTMQIATTSWYCRPKRAIPVLDAGTSGTARLAAAIKTSPVLARCANTRYRRGTVDRARPGFLHFIRRSVRAAWQKSCAARGCRKRH